MPSPKVGSIISYIRMRRGFSQEYVSFNLNMSQKTISRIEQDGNSLSIARLKKISDFLDVDALRLISIYFDEKQKPTDTDIETISNIVDKSCNQKCDLDSCPYKKKICQLEVEVEKLKGELKH